MAFDIGRAADLVLVPVHEDAVPGQDQVRLDHVRALFDGQFIGRARVFGPLAGGAAVGDDQGLRQGRRSRQKDQGAQDETDHPPWIGQGRDRPVTPYAACSTLRRCGCSSVLDARIDTPVLGSPSSSMVVTRPPASVTNSMPAATSQGFRLRS